MNIEQAIKAVLVALIQGEVHIYGGKASGTRYFLHGRHGSTSIEIQEVEAITRAIHLELCHFADFRDGGRDAAIFSADEVAALASTALRQHPMDEVKRHWGYWLPGAEDAPGERCIEYFKGDEVDLILAVIRHGLDGVAA